MSARITAVSLTGLLALTLAIVTLMAAASTAQAEERVCRGTIGGATVDNLRVPQGAACTLNGTRVEGTIKVERNATLTASGVRVKGNVQSEEFKTVRLVNGSVVVGSVQLKNGLSGGLASVNSSRINGDLQFESNRARVVTRGSTVLANLQAVQNKGGVAFTNNRISENLQCKENNPRPTGGGNVAGDKEGQCAAL